MPSIDREVVAAGPAAFGALTCFRFPPRSDQDRLPRPGLHPEAPPVRGSRRKKSRSWRDGFADILEY